jgi:hypothetical protein
VVKWLLWDGSNLVKALLHQTTAIVASLVTPHSVNPSLRISQGSKRIFSFRAAEERVGVRQKRVGESAYGLRLKASIAPGGAIVLVLDR